jgi:RHS repeat-associated protein
MWQMSNGTAEWLQSKHIYLGEERIATKYNSEGNDNTNAEEKRTYYYHSDHLGSAQLVTNSDGQMHERLEYTPYGELWINWHTDTAKEDSTPYRFTGKERDEETGLYYYGARYLDPKTSRWLSSDPAMGDYLPGAPINDEAKKRNGNLPGQGGVFNVVNLHTYHYAGNNPVKYTDPDGRTPRSAMWKVLGVGSFVAAGVVAIAGIAAVSTGVGASFVPLAAAATKGLAAAGVAAFVTGALDEAIDAPVNNGITNSSTSFNTDDLAGSISISETRNHPKGAPKSIDGIERDNSGARGDKHAHGANDEWAINEDGTVHDGNTGRVPKDAADYLKGKGFKIPEDRYPLPSSGGVQ